MFSSAAAKTLGRLTSEFCPWGDRRYHQLRRQSSTCVSVYCICTQHAATGYTSYFLLQMLCRLSACLCSLVDPAWLWNSWGLWMFECLGLWDREHSCTLSTCWYMHTFSILLVCSLFLITLLGLLHSDYDTVHFEYLLRDFYYSKYFTGLLSLHSHTLTNTLVQTKVTETSCIFQYGATRSISWIL